MPLTAPTPTVASTTPTSFTLTWPAATGGTPGYVYGVNFGTVSGVYTQEVDDVTSPLVCSNGDLELSIDFHAGGTYYVQLFVNDQDGNGDPVFSSEISVTLPTTGPKNQRLSLGLSLGL